MNHHFRTPSFQGAAHAPNFSPHNAAEYNNDAFYYADESTQTHAASGWYEVSCVEAGVGGSRGDAVRTVAFDPVKELVWVGTASGMLHAHCASDMSRVVSSYISQPPIGTAAVSEDVRDIVVSKTAVMAAMGYGLAVVTKGGALRTSLRADTIKDAKGIALNPMSEAHVCIGGESRMLAVVDLQQNRILRQATLRGATSVTRALWAAPDVASSLTIFSTATGRISFCDPASMREINAVAAFAGPATMIASSGYYLAATGLGTRGGVSYLEQQVKMFDIRSLQTPLPSVMFPTPPMYLTFDSYTASMYNADAALWILSPNGLLQCMDLSALTSGGPAYPLTDPIQLDAGTDVFTAATVSSRGLLALGDAGGFVHLWSCEENVKVNEDSEPIWTAPFSTEPPRPSIRLDGLLTSDIGVTIPKCVLPDYGNTYLTEEVFGPRAEPENSAGAGQSSATYEDRLVTGKTLYKRRPFARFPLRVSDEILQSSKQHSFVAYAQAPPSFLRNSNAGHKKPPIVEGMHGKRITKDKSRERVKQASSGKDLDLSEPHAKSHYVEMDLVAWESIEGFDFHKYNKSALFCGLENALPNVYVNAAVQVLYFTPPIRRAIGTHACDRQWCISCELGFLFHMFDLGGAGMACEAGNFTRAFMTMANADALGLLDGPHALPLSQRIENFTRYLLEQLHKDAASAVNSTVSSVFGSDTLSFGTFLPSKNTWRRVSRPYQHTLMYSLDGNAKELSFCELLKRSLSYSLEPTRAFCEASGAFEIMSQKRELKTLPNLLLLGCNTKIPEHDNWWFANHTSPDQDQSRSNGIESKLDELKRAAADAIAAPKKLIQSMRIELGEEVSVIDISGDSTDPDNTVFGYDRSETHGASKDTGSGFAEYDLSFVLAHVPAIQESTEKDRFGNSKVKNQGGHLVAYIRVPQEYREIGSGRNRSKEEGLNLNADWWCFNDFVISPCEGFDEVAAFDKQWKKPCMVGYVRRDIWQRVEASQSENVLDVRQIIGSENQNEAIGLEDDEEAPGRGSLLGLDCEFVMVGREEANIFGDGRCEVVVPSRKALARVSVVRGYGKLKGKALIDDYVAVREPVVDYLTRFSGLQEGDLDVGRSRHKVSSLKTVYKRLKCLVDAGCVFVGHGLKSDFRIINFVVPPEQVVDTVTLFRVANKRLLGLRFLSQTLLGEDIQAVTHDSIEDSAAALRLYETYLKLKGAEGGRDVFEHNVKKLYTYGYQKGWKADTDEAFVIDWSAGGS